MNIPSQYRLIFILSAIILLVSCEDKGTLEKLNDQVFIKLYGGVGSEEGFDFIQLDDGGFVIVGSTSSYNEGDIDVFVVRTDKNGDQIWANHYGDEMANVARSLTISANNTIVLCGETLQGNGRRDILVKEIDLSGAELRTLTHGSATEDEHGVDIVNAISDGYLILGNTIFGSIEQPDSSYFYLLEVDLNLQVKPNRDRPLIGRKNKLNTAAAVSIFQDQEYLCFGNTLDGGGGTNAPLGSQNMYIFKIPEVGDGTNSQNFFGTTAKEIGTAFTKVGGGYLLVGYQINGNRNLPYLVKVNNNLSLQPVWESVIDVPYKGVSISRTPTSVIEANDGNYLILMNSFVQPFGTEIGIMKVDVSGQNVIWENNFGSNNNDNCGKLIDLEEGGVVMCGSIGFGEENNEVINKMGLIKTNSFGELVPLD